MISYYTLLKEEPKKEKGKKEKGGKEGKRGKRDKRQELRNTAPNTADNLKRAAVKDSSL